MDGASNNGSMLEHLKVLLTKRGIPTHFDPIDNRVWCHAHTVDLCRKAVVGRLPDDAEETQDDDEPSTRHPIALACAVVRAVRGSGLRREGLKEVIRNGNEKKWFKDGGKTIKVEQNQLLRYVRTRWDSCYHMLLRLRELRPVSASLDPWEQFYLD